MMWLSRGKRVEGVVGGHEAGERERKGVCRERMAPASSSAREASGWCGEVLLVELGCAAYVVVEKDENVASGGEG
jgi:hypothetical protein